MTLARPFHSVGLGDEEVFCLSFSPFEWSKNFLAIGTENKVVVANVQYENVSLSEKHYGLELIMFSNW